MKTPFWARWSRPEAMVTLQAPQAVPDRRKRPVPASAFEPHAQPLQRRLRGWLLREQSLNQFFISNHS
jgi:hypothetical protein